MSVEVQAWGKDSQGNEINLYTLEGSRGMKVTVSNYGALLVKLLVPDAEGNLADVVLGYDTVEEYFENPDFLGATIGPSANRIGGASFELDGKSYALDANDNGNNLHSHKELGYHKRLWQAVVGENFVTFILEDEDGSMGFPGKKSMEVTYGLKEDNALCISYHGRSDQKTILNPTNHSYFNLEGHDGGSILDHELQLFASCYTPVVEGFIPTGEIASVEGTPLDFRQGKRIGGEIDADFDQLKLAQGYDHNWVIDGWDNSLRLAAVLKAPKSGRVMKTYTTLPGIQFYAGNLLGEKVGKDGAVYKRRDGLCLETQYFPDTVHHDNFPSCVMEEDQSVTVYQF